MLSVCQAPCLSPATPREENPLRLLLFPVLQMRLGAGWSGFPRPRPYSWGVGSAGMVETGTGGKVLKRKFCPENYIWLGLRDGFVVDFATCQTLRSSSTNYF